MALWTGFGESDGLAGCSSGALSPMAQMVRMGCRDDQCNQLNVDEIRPDEHLFVSSASPDRQALRHSVVVLLGAVDSKPDKKSHQENHSTIGTLSGAVTICLKFGSVALRIRKIIPSGNTILANVDVHTIRVCRAAGRKSWRW